MDFYVYILESLMDGTYYIGFTSDLNKRLDYHNTGKSKYTSRKMPWKVVYTEVFASRSAAMKRERFLKGQRNSEFYRKIISS